MVKSRILKVDGKKRITLGKLVPEGIEGYKAQMNADGSILLLPMLFAPSKEVEPGIQLIDLLNKCGAFNV